MRARFKGMYRNCVDDDGAYWCFTEHWDNQDVIDWKYGIAEYAFVPGYNVISFNEENGEGHFSYERVLSNHKTLTEAIAILRLLMASDPEAVTVRDEYY